MEKLVDEELTAKQAYEAMYDFLNDAYERTKSDAIGSMLGDMSTLCDGQVVDDAMWSDWLESIAKAKAGRVNTRLELH